MGNRIGKVLGDLRISLELSQEEFGEKIGYSGSYVSGIETGKFDITERFLHTVVMGYACEMTVADRRVLTNQLEVMRAARKGIVIDTERDYKRDYELESKMQALEAENAKLKEALKAIKEVVGGVIENS